MKTQILFLTVAIGQGRSGESFTYRFRFPSPLFFFLFPTCELSEDKKNRGSLLTKMMPSYLITYFIILRGISRIRPARIKVVDPGSPSQERGTFGPNFWLISTLLPCSGETPSRGTGCE